MEKPKVSKKILVGGVFFLAQTLLTGCDTGPEPKALKNPGTHGEWEIENDMADKPAGVMTEVAEVAPESFRIVNEYPSRTTGVVVNRLNGMRETIPAENLEAIMGPPGQQPGGYGLGSVLASGLAGYMLGRNTSLNPAVYKNTDLFAQSLANRELIERRLKEEEDKRPGWSGRSYYYGYGRRYDGRDHTLRSPDGSVKTAKASTGFFSRFTSSMRSFSG
jgi:hypothetical protein